MLQQYKCSVEVKSKEKLIFTDVRQNDGFFNLHKKFDFSAKSINLIFKSNCNTSLEY